MNQSLSWIVALVLFVTTSAFSKQTAVNYPVTRAVDHPITAAHPVRSAGMWRKGVGEFGETFVDGILKARGYQEVKEVKLGSNHGVDRVALKRDGTGALKEVKLVEAKAHYGKGKPKLGMTKNGRQMSRDWLADWLKKLRNSGKANRALAKEISDFVKARKIPLTTLGEVHDINLRSGKYTVRNSLTMAERSGPISIERLLGNIASRSRNQEISVWAKRNLVQFDQIRMARMNSWLTEGTNARALNSVTTRNVATQITKQSAKGGERAILRAAGPIGIAIAISVDVHEVYGHVRDFRAGKISKRERNIAVSRSIGGIYYAAQGAWIGAEVGAAVGSLGGPAAPVTVPVGAVVGGAAGGALGYQAGAHIGESAASAYYRTLDKTVKNNVDAWFIQTPLPLSV